MDDNVESEGRPRQQPLMLKEWLELEYSAELSRFVGCYPRHLATDEPRSAAGCRRRRDGHVIARVSAAVRAALALSLPLSSARARQGEAAALLRSLSTRLRVVGFWKKQRREVGQMDGRPVASCSATAASSGRRDKNGASSPATSPRRMGRESRHAGEDRVGLSGARRGPETMKVDEGCECEATCHLDEERGKEQEQRLSPVSVMDFESQDGDDDCNDDSGGCDGHSEDEGTSPTFERSLANIRRASQQLLQRIRRFEQLAELDTSDEDAAATTVDDDMSCHVGELDSSAEDDDDAGCRPARRDLPGLPEASSPHAAHCFKKLLEDFFREGLSSCHAGGSDDPHIEMSLLEIAKTWLDGRHGALKSTDQKAEVEIERLGRWRCFREDEHELLSSDVEGSIFCYLMEELVEELC